MYSFAYRGDFSCYSLCPSLLTLVPAYTCTKAKPVPFPTVQTDSANSKINLFFILFIMPNDYT